MIQLKISAISKKKIEGNEQIALKQKKKNGKISRTKLNPVEAKENSQSYPISIPANEGNWLSEQIKGKKHD